MFLEWTCYQRASWHSKIHQVWGYFTKKNIKINCSYVISEDPPLGKLGIALQNRPDLWILVVWFLKDWTHASRNNMYWCVFSVCACRKLNNFTEPHLVLRWGITWWGSSLNDWGSWKKRAALLWDNVVMGKEAMGLVPGSLSTLKRNLILAAS